MTFSFDLCLFREPRWGVHFQAPALSILSSCRHKYEQWPGRPTSLSRALLSVSLGRHRGSVAQEGVPCAWHREELSVAPECFHLPEDLVPVATAQGPPSALLISVGLWSPPSKSCWSPNPRRSRRRLCVESGPFEGSRLNGEHYSGHSSSVAGAFQEEEMAGPRGDPWRRHQLPAQEKAWRTSPADTLVLGSQAA